MVVVEADYNVLPLEEQLKIDVQTDVMVGPHGAGLTHSVQRETSLLTTYWFESTGSSG